MMPLAVMPEEEKEEEQQRAIVLVAQQEVTKAAENHAQETQLHATMPLAVMPEEEEELMILVVFQNLQILRHVSAVRLGGYRMKAAPSVNPAMLENPHTVMNHIANILIKITVKHILIRMESFVQVYFTFAVTVPQESFVQVKRATAMELVSKEFNYQMKHG